MGRLVALEGIDGAGTTTQAARLARHFGAHLTREPSDGPLGVELRRILRGERGPVDETAVALLFAADRMDHLQREIRPQLASKDVLSDRYVLSSIVYQGLTLDPDFVAAINARGQPADLTLLLDVPASVAESRRAARGGPVERYDDAGTQARLVEAYRRHAARLPNLVVIDGSPDADAVFAALLPHVQSCLGRR